MAKPVLVMTQIVVLQLRHVTRLDAPAQVGAQFGLRNTLYQSKSGVFQVIHVSPLPCTCLPHAIIYWVRSHFGSTRRRTAGCYPVLGTANYQTASRSRVGEAVTAGSSSPCLTPEGDTNGSVAVLALPCQPWWCLVVRRRVSLVTW